VKWTAKFRLEESDQWRACRLIDISQTGVALEPFESTEGVSPGAKIEIDFAVPEKFVDSFRFLGAIRHMTRTATGDVYMGVEFTGLTRLDTELLELLVRLDWFA
jgi:hypothetical protein